MDTRAKTDLIAQTIHEEAARNEKIVAWLRCGIALAILPDFLRPALRVAVFWMDIGCLAYLIVALLTTYRWSRWPGFKYVIMTTDALVAVYFTLINLEPWDPTSNFLALGLYGCLLVATASIRMSQGAVAYATALVVASLAAVVFCERIEQTAPLAVTTIVLILGCLSYFVMTRLSGLLTDVTQKERLARFLPPELVAQAVRDPELLQLGGKRQSVTILFADIRRFSAAAEAHTPEEVIGFLNDYFRVTSEAIFRHGGTLDKFMGDGFMALFGAPIAHADDADRAARAAVEIMEHLAKLNREKADSGFCPLVIGIGMNTADVIAGNVGTDRRMEYTVIGDGVNIAARLEKLTKKYEAKILISQAMYDRLSHKASAIPYGEAVLEGRSNPTRIYGIRHVGMDASMTR